MKLVLRLVFIFLLIGLFLTLLGGLVFYLKLSPLVGGYGVYKENRPDHIVYLPEKMRFFDLSGYQMKRYEHVVIPSLNDLYLDAWWIPGNPALGTVVLVPGHDSSKADTRLLLVASMLNKTGHSVLMVDYRDQGMGSMEDGRTALGTEEYLDVIASLDWLKQEKGIPYSKMGLYGCSLGGAIALMATADRPIPKTFVEASFSSQRMVTEDEMKRLHYPAYFMSPGFYWAQILAGDRLDFPSPLSQIKRYSSDKTVFLAHGYNDERIPVKHAHILAEALEKTNVRMESWLHHQPGHCDTVYLIPIEYAQKLNAFFEFSQ